MSDVQEQGAGSNAPNQELVEQMLKSHWRIEDDINSKRMQHMSVVGGLRKQQASIKERIKDAGVSVRAFRELCNEEADRRRIANRKAKLEDDDTELVDLMRPALGVLAELPLGMAAIDAAEKKKASADRKKALNNELDGLASTAPAADPADAQVAENVHRLETGIKAKGARGAKSTQH